MLSKTTLNSRLKLARQKAGTESFPRAKGGDALSLEVSPLNQSSFVDSLKVKVVLQVLLDCI